MTDTDAVALSTKSRLLLELIMANEKVNILDCRGMVCPQPVLKTRIALDRIADDEILEVLADDPAAEEDISRLVKRLEYTLISIDKEKTHLAPAISAETLQYHFGKHHMGYYNKLVKALHTEGFPLLYPQGSTLHPEFPTFLVDLFLSKKKI